MHSGSPVPAGARELGSVSIVERITLAGGWSAKVVRAITPSVMFWSVRASPFSHTALSSSLTYAPVRPPSPTDCPSTLTPVLRPGDCGVVAVIVPNATEAGALGMFSGDPVPAKLHRTIWPPPEVMRVPALSAGSIVSEAGFTSPDEHSEKSNWTTLTSFIAGPLLRNDTVTGTTCPGL